MIFTEHFIMSYFILKLAFIENLGLQKFYSNCADNTRWLTVNKLECL